MNNKWLILLDLSLQLCRAGSYFMWKTLLMKAFQPLASSSNNILDLPCQQTCLETWLPSQTWQKHHQVQKTNWWAFWKGTTRGRSISVMFHSKRKLFRRKNRRLFAVFVHYDKNLPFLDRIKYWNGGKGSPVFCRIWSRHPSVLVPTSGRHSPSRAQGTLTVCDSRRGWWCLPWRDSQEHQAAQMRNPKAVHSEARLAQPSPKGALFPPAQTGASRWQRWQLQLDLSLDRSLFPLSVTLLLSFSPINTHMLYSWSCIQTRGKPPEPGIMKVAGKLEGCPYSVLEPVTATWLYLGVVEGESFRDNKTVRLWRGAFFKLLQPRLARFAVKIHLLLQAQSHWREPSWLLYVSWFMPSYQTGLLLASLPSQSSSCLTDLTEPSWPGVGSSDPAPAKLFALQEGSPGARWHTPKGLKIPILKLCSDKVC